MNIQNEGAAYKRQLKRAHNSEVGVIEEAPLPEHSVVAEGAVVMAVVGYHATQPVLRGGRITHDSVEHLRDGWGGRMGRESITASSSHRSKIVVTTCMYIYK